MARSMPITSRLLRHATVYCVAENEAAGTQVFTEVDVAVVVEM